jgi:hypothetical protein
MRSAKDNRRRSMRQERKLAMDTEATQQRGSGASKFYKGDVRKKGVFRAECKFTSAKSFILKLEELDKIRGECAFGETPVFDVTFTDRNGRTVDRWVAVPYEEWLKQHAPSDDS